mmetsp:Transcript_32345/g.48234  ORF Transcript_32345/g.48234 Transcript_32345/m.48234 type:complete len:443 (-) Transcript_32345:43-1371(-)
MIANNNNSMMVALYTTVVVVWILNLSGFAQGFHNLPLCNSEKSLCRSLHPHVPFSTTAGIFSLIHSRNGSPNNNLVSPLYARKGTNKKRRVGRSSRKGGSKATTTSAAAAVLEAKDSTSIQQLNEGGRNVHMPQSKQIKISFNQKTTLDPSSSKEGQQHSTVQVSTYQVNDVNWWKSTTNINPYGAKVWPSSIGVAQFLATTLFKSLSVDNSGSSSEKNIHVLELGCGTGLASIVAASCGASTVIASDVSDVALYLTQKGWQKTRTKKHKHDKEQMETQTSKSLHPPCDFSTLYFDICDISTPLPIPASFWKKQMKDNTSKPSATAEIQQQCQQRQSIVIATAMLYELDLAKALASRVVEAYRLGAWIIIGDDDTGERDGGRDLFLTELDRLMMELSNACGDDMPQILWTTSVVKNQKLGWMGKSVKLLHLNPPPSAIDSLL